MPRVMENLEAPKSSQEQEKATVILPRFTASQQSRDGTVLDHQIEASVNSSSVEPFQDRRLEDIPDVAAKPEDAKPEAVRCVTDQPKIIEDPTRKETLNASTKGKALLLRRPKIRGRREVKLKSLRCQVTQEKNIATVVLHGAAGTAVGSTINGHAKRRGSKLTQQHHIYGPVAHTNENRTNRCLDPLFSTDHKALPPTVPSPFLQL
ncbi:hypothetical protein F5H01DRAFT_326678 [Linnemannia elongata]|nr:hypothetical protein F5H01DRAFT_326678 [Linnemannia elongata]